MIDLETKHLEIKTNSTLGSGDEINVDIYVTHRVTTQEVSGSPSPPLHSITSIGAQ